ncbi:MAG TPA: hypothetical protein VFP25_01575, partial [Nitrososphaeraceae archaeon]|nr:hypothetical protein [Nitrososphaeraceae archaeon]
MINLGIKPEDIVTFDKLMKNSHDFTLSHGGEPSKFDNKYEVMKIIDIGYNELPQIYYDIFLDPLKEFVHTERFDVIQENYGNESNILDDWLSCVSQRRNIEEQIKEMKDLTPKQRDEIKYLGEATTAFEEFIADLYDGSVSESARRGAQLPVQIVPPLTKWGGNSPYTYGSKIGELFGMSMSILSMPTKYSRNILFWPLGGHECYHSLVDAYGTNLLNELEDLLTDAFDSLGKNKAMNEETLDKDLLNEITIWRKSVEWNKDNNPLAQFASRYWRRIMNETVADVCSLLNLGPSAGVAFAVLAITISGNELRS